MTLEGFLTVTDFLALCLGYALLSLPFLWAGLVLVIKGWWGVARLRAERRILAAQGMYLPWWGLPDLWLLAVWEPNSYGSEECWPGVGVWYCPEWPFQFGTVRIFKEDP